MQATKSHHFAHPTNHFYRALSQSGITSSLIPPNLDYTFPTLQPFTLGLTNLCARPTVASTGLSPQELSESVEGFMKKVSRERPKVVCFVGKGVGETVKKWVHDNYIPKGSKVKVENKIKKESSKKQDSSEQNGQIAEEENDLQYLDFKEDAPIFNEKESNAFGFLEFCLVHRKIEDSIKSERDSISDSIVTLSDRPIKREDLQGEESSKETNSSSNRKSTQTQFTLFYVTASTSARVTSIQLPGKVVHMKKLRENVEILVGKTADVKEVKVEEGTEDQKTSPRKSSRIKRTPIKLGEADERGLRMVSLQEEKTSNESSSLKKFGFKKISL